MSDEIRIAMWSGPRNISTALLRSWGNREDTAVCDEPLYAHYLRQTAAEHPGREQVIAHHESDWRKVVARLTGPIPGGKRIFYQKHMAHHLLDNIDRGWLDELTHCFLIREPREMITSLMQKLPHPTLADTGLPQQVEILNYIQERRGVTPAVLDARDVLEDPRGMLARLCAATGVAFSETMLSWPGGPRPTDGIWARHWYANVERSTGFAPYRPKSEDVPDRLRPLLRACQTHYDALYALRLGAA